MLFAVLAFLATVWMSIPVYISCFRIFKLYLPDWGAWLMPAGMVVRVAEDVDPYKMTNQKQPYDPVVE
jgi:hypothetical protein